MDHSAALLQQHPIISDQVNRAELLVILQQLEATLAAGVPGDVVELGCYVGTTSLFLQRLLQQLAPGKILHVYDSFAGLPPKAHADSSPVGHQFKAGELTASKAALIKHFKQAGLPLPIIHKGWFADLRPADVSQKIAFAFLDGDFYDSILDSLRIIWPVLMPGATVIIDDYQAEALPGAQRAVDEWLRHHKAKINVQASLAILRPQ